MRVEENFNLDVRSDYFVVDLRAKIAVVGDTDVQYSYRNLASVFLLLVSPMFMAVRGVEVRDVWWRLKSSSSLVLSKH